MIFAGTTDFSATALQELIEAGHTISLVLTKPDAISGRGLSLRPTPVKTLALQHNLKIEQPQTLKNKEIQQAIKSANADFMVVAAYGIILPQDVLDIPKFGCLNIHGSLLPKWRGAAPIQRAILAGDKETGITIIKMNAGLDTGDMLSKYHLEIDETDTSGTIFKKMSTLGAKAIVETIQNYHSIIPIPQPLNNVSYAEKIKKEEAKIDWNLSAEYLDRLIRAFNPSPGCFSTLDNQLIKIWQTNIIKFSNEKYKPGEIIEANSKGIIVATGDNAISIQLLQPAGSSKMSVQSFSTGRQQLVGKIFI